MLEVTVTVSLVHVQAQRRYYIKHGLDGPAIERVNGTKAWYLNGQLHRLDGPAIETCNGDKSWYIHGKLHRVDGPAVEYVNGFKAWFFNNRRHRLDGPAIENVNGEHQWFLNGVSQTKVEFDAEITRLTAVQIKCVAWLRMRKLRRFVKLCRSREFNELWYGEGGVGRKWDHHSLVSLELNKAVHHSLVSLELNKAVHHSLPSFTLTKGEADHHDLVSLSLNKAVDNSSTALTKLSLGDTPKYNNGPSVHD